MKLHDHTAEVPFDAKIDARFPYEDRVASNALIMEAREISLNAVFCVLEELCRPPASSAVTKDRQHELVTEWSSAFEHELKGPLVRCANALISGQALPWPEAVAVIEQIGRFDAQRAALSLAYFSGDCDSEDGDAALELAYRRVIKVWEQMGV
jgi:hypothetical protein